MADKCKHCGALILETAKFCSECGVRIERELKCSNCGTTLAENAKFCIECGTKIGESEIIPQIQEEPKDESLVSPNLEIEVNNTASVVEENAPIVLDKIPDDLDLMNYMAKVKYIMKNEPSILSKIAQKVNTYNEIAPQKGYSTIKFDVETRTLEGELKPEEVQVKTSKLLVITFAKMMAKDLKIRGFISDFYKICQLCESISIKPLMELEEITNGTTAPKRFTIIADVNKEDVNKEDVNKDKTPPKYINEVWPYPVSEFKAPNGEPINESEFSVVYTLSNNSGVIAKILEKVNKYNTKAQKYGFPTIKLNQETLIVEGDYRPLPETPDISFSKKMSIDWRNINMGDNFLEICKLCETIMVRE